MPLRKDESGRRWVEMDWMVPGTPEQVWHAMASGPGNTAWFLEAEIEPRVGGALRFDFGEGVTTSGEVTTWNPPHQFGYVEREWEAGAPPVATQITITARSGDRCVVRMVHSLFASTDDWDDQLEGFESGWPGFLQVLRLYLAHHAGMAGASFMAITATDRDHLSAWLELVERLQLAGANVGERRATASGPEAWSGVVEHVLQDDRQRWVILRVDEPSPGVVLVGTHASRNVGAVEEQVGKRAGTSVGVCRYFYGAGAADLAVESEAAWRDWLSEVFVSADG